MYQSWRVHLQVQEWLCRHQDPTAWGGKCIGGRYKPIMASQGPVPEFLMAAIFFSSKTGLVANTTCIAPWPVALIMVTATTLNVNTKVLI